MDMHFYGAKGGVGTSALSVITALEAARKGHRVELWVSGSAEPGDLLAILGAPEPCDLPINVNELVGLPAADPQAGAFGITDWGTTVPKSQPGDRVVMVLRNDYLSLRRALAKPAGEVIMVTEPHRSLGVRDAREVLNRPITSVEYTERLARWIDAGLLYSRRLPDLGLGITDAIPDLALVASGEVA